MLPRSIALVLRPTVMDAIRIRERVILWEVIKKNMLWLSCYSQVEAKGFNTLLCAVGDLYRGLSAYRPFVDLLQSLTGSLPLGYVIRIPVQLKGNIEFRRFFSLVVND